MEKGEATRLRTAGLRGGERPTAVLEGRAGWGGFALFCFSLLVSRQKANLPQPLFSKEGSKVKEGSKAEEG
ncbi:MAG: hypothetical protein KY442_10880, partial [Proteobacteria bacterium]|nr:hypothetical protein [Pseudomonadota bacterium]